MNTVIPSFSRIIIVLLSAFGLAFSPLSWAGDKPAAKAALTVTVATPQLENWSVGITANGPLTAWQEAVIAAEIGGQRVDKILVDVGDKVTKDQELATLAQESVQADLKQQEAKVAQAEASLSAARVNAERARQLKSSGSLPILQIDQYLTEEATAKANLRAQQAALQSQKIRLKQTHILAVDDGVVSARNATLGAVVQAGTELFRLVRQNRVEWQAQVAARDFGQVQPGQKAVLTLPTGERVDGEVRALSPTLDTNTRTATAYVSLPAGGPAKAGMFAQGEILSGANQALTLPHTAVILRDGNNYVFTIGADGRVSRVQVAVGRRSDKRVEITSGLESGVKVAATGGAFLNDGDNVRVVDESGPQP